jgi:hypothetical protein
MAFKIKGADFFSDARNLVDVNLAGITTALNVGPTGAETFTVDGFTGIATAAGLKVGSSVVFNGETTDLGVEASTTQLASASAIKTFVQAEVSNATGGSGDFSGGDLDLTGNLTADGTGSFGSTVTFDDTNTGTSGFRVGTAGQEISSIDTDISLGGVAAGNSALPTQLAVKTYVDNQFANNNTFEFSVEGDTEQSLDLTGDSINFIGGTNLTASLAVSGTAGDETYDLTFDLDSDVTIGNNLDINGNLTFDNIGPQISEFVTDLSGNNNNTSVPTSSAVLAAISSGVSGGAPSIELNDSGNTAGKYYLPIASAVGNGSQQALVTDDTLYYDPATGQLNAQEFNSLSDIRYKENIELIESPMAKVEALRGVTYDWKSSGNASAGIIAQEVQAVMPELISEQEDRLTVNYNGLTGLLIEAVKELSAEVAALKAAQ